MVAAVIWRRTAGKIRIQDMKDNNFDNVMELISNEYVHKDIFYGNFKISKEQSSMELFLSQVYNHLWQFKSLIALDETKRNKIVGFLILYPTDENFIEPFIEECFESGTTYGYITRLMGKVQRGVNLFEMFDSPKIMRFSLLHVCDDYRHKGLASAMFDVACNVTRAHSIPVISCISTSPLLDSIAYDYGMHKIKEVFYGDYQDNCLDLHLAAIMFPYESCSFMAGFIPPEPPPEPLPIVVEPKSKKGKKGKKDKKGGKKKK